MGVSYKLEFRGPFRDVLYRYPCGPQHLVKHTVSGWVPYEKIKGPGFYKRGH